VHSWSRGRARSVGSATRHTRDQTLHPHSPNQQTPHEQDELYVVIRGRGVLVHDDKRDPFDSGDILFVAAGIEHHYEDFSDDLALWRIFYGRRGGEIPP
jgi:mannose-6-phosphate isomerase-like protein (cupin superfamily)